MIEQIKLFMDSYNLSAADLADAIDVQRSGISHLLSGRNKPSLSFITKILEKYPELSPDWLLFDKGAMIRGERSKESDSPKRKYVSNLFDGIDEEDNEAITSDKEEIIEEETANNDIDEASEELIDIVNRDDASIYRMESEIEKIVVFYKDRSFIEYKTR